MGYTNYWYGTDKAITRSFVDKVKKIITEANNMGISIRGWDGTGQPTITLNDIRFNGNAQYDLNHETCSFTNIATNRGFNFCKTVAKPYDWVVKQVLKEAEKENLVFDVSDDGEVEKVTDAEYRFNKWLVQDVRKSFGLESNDCSRDKEILCMSRQEIFNRWLEYEGIVGYTEKILSKIEKIYKITLKED